MRVGTVLITLGCLLALVGCTKEAESLGGGTGRTESSLISGRVFDAEKNEPVRNATVSTNEGKTTTTDAEGNFTVEATPGKTVITVEDSDHAKGVKEVEAYQDAESYVEVFSKPVVKDSSLSATTGGMVKVGDMTVLLPADSLESEDGTKYNGQVTVEVATVRPEKASELSAFPGKFDGTTVDGDPGSVATRAAASLRLLNAAGQPLRMSGAARVEIFLPIRSAISQRVTRLWRLQEQSADWAEVPFPAVRTLDPITQLPALRSAVAALTWWNAGEPFLKSRIRGCLQLPGGSGEGGTTGGTMTRDASIGPGGASGGGNAGTGGASDGTGGGGSLPIGGASGSAGAAGGVDAGFPRQQAPLIGDNPLAGIQVVAVGIGYGYFAERYTDDNGCFDLDVKASGPVAVYAQTLRLRSVPQPFMAPPAGEIEDIGMLPLGDRTGNCPGVMEDCNGQCVDFLTDDNNCGTCGSTCGAEPSVEFPTLVPIHCVFGQCGCDDNQDDTCLDGACANVETDTENCGGCGNYCPSDHECVDATCVQVPVTCGAGEVDCGGTCVPADPGCTAVDPGGIDCGAGVACPGYIALSSYFVPCCTSDNLGNTSCGVGGNDGAPAQLANACAATEYGRVADSAVCPDATRMELSSLGSFAATTAAGCCRSDGQCGLMLDVSSVVSGAEDLGCILRTDVSADLAPIGCGAFGADAGPIGGAGGGAAGGTGGTAGTGGTGGMSGADAGVPLMDAGL